jgi:hypothetical protein
MTRFVAVLFAVAGLASAARADIPPPPPPMGKKYVSVSNEVVLGKDVTGYVFVVQSSFGPGRPIITHCKLELPVGKAVEIYVGGKHGSALYAIPEAVAKEFKTDQELYGALELGKVPGVHSIGFSGTTTVSRSVLGKSVKWTTTITGIDANGIKTKVEGKGAEPPNKPGKDSPTAVQTPHGVPCVGSIAAFAALTLGGFWLAGRTRRAKA